RRSLALFAVLVVAGSVLAACGGDDDGGSGRGSGGSASGGSGAKDQPLEGTEWILDQESSGLTPVPTAVVTAQFSSDGRLTGNAGCNNYTSSYETDGSDM